jgi:uncharacterized membrane protein
VLHKQIVSNGSPNNQFKQKQNQTKRTKIKQTKLNGIKKWDKLNQIKIQNTQTKTRITFPNFWELGDEITT